MDHRLQTDSEERLKALLTYSKPRNKGKWLSILIEKKANEAKTKKNVYPHPPHYIGAPLAPLSLESLIGHRNW